MGKRSPVIGITTYGRDRKNVLTLPSEYVDSVRRSGALPVVLPSCGEYSDEMLGPIDGLVLVGGGDIEPQRFGGVGHERTYMVDTERDDLEFKLALKALEIDMPILAICRGAQVVNVALGGDLFEHLPEKFGTQVAHRLPPREPTPHPMSIEPGSMLARVMGCTETTSQSWHHQALKNTAPGLEVVARAADGMIEGFEMPGQSWFLAVQWHPELTAADDPAQQRLFDGLARAAVEFRGISQEAS
ncbi:MAG: gamma-glutamyl-gamma-aminobutyrate hydrolase family protein [Candidatus Latescibacteria bacterium]|nr:gamma-glutamyl-gamma-aminobutyrate hydrolase family protein [Candidatus Latescibacterota bacterium]